MKVILREDVDNLGYKGEVVTVKDGYGRNYLIPRGLAAVANRGNLKAIEEEARQATNKITQARGNAEALADQLNKLEVAIRAKVGEEERIFGTITTQQVADALNERGLDIDRRKIELKEEIRALGVYPAMIKLHRDIVAEVKVRVVPENQEATQA